MSSGGRTIPTWVLRGIEWIFATSGAVVCIGVAIATASQQFGDLWPTPGLYLLEIILLALVALASRLLDTGLVKTDYGAITWMTGGVLLAFVILAGFSIGPYLFPSMLAFWLAAAAGDQRQRRPIPPHLALALVAAVFQAGLIGLLLLLSSAIRA